MKGAFGIAVFVAGIVGGIVAARMVQKEDLVLVSLVLSEAVMFGFFGGILVGFWAENVSRDVDENGKKVR